ncbi:hypothetical protein LCGC14_1810280 [marine sediment metagenome]|uniref:Uncharacterized protein n=1 Tax=marine sediment metagenome TaxID=412755 RepID=A0A0F9JLQ3_9ZZZZ
MIKGIDTRMTYTPKEAAMICLKSIIEHGYFGDEIDSKFICYGTSAKKDLYKEIERMSIELIEKFLKEKGKK